MLILNLWINFQQFSVIMPKKTIGKIKNLPLKYEQKQIFYQNVMKIFTQKFLLNSLLLNNLNI